jgi:hypothetical protein
MSVVAPTEIKERKVDTIKVTINEREVIAKKGETVLEAALNAGIYIPTLCYDPDLKPYGGCRVPRQQPMVWWSTPRQNG